MLNLEKIEKIFFEDIIEEAKRGEVLIPDENGTLETQPDTTVIDETGTIYISGANESGLCVAALNFPKCAVYNKPQKDFINIV